MKEPEKIVKETGMLHKVKQHLMASEIERAAELYLNIAPVIEYDVIKNALNEQYFDFIEYFLFETLIKMDVWLYPGRKELEEKLAVLKPKISVCIIARNEQEYIERCLKSLLPVAYEIIVLDTGSTDRTKEIVRQFAETYNSMPLQKIRLYETTWEDDFAKARNESLKYATGEWVLIIDADEELTEETQVSLLRFLAHHRNNRQPLAFNFKFFEPQPDNSTMTITYYKNTLFRNGFDIIFKNPVHEKLFSPAYQIIFESCPFLTIKHNGNFKSHKYRHDKLVRYKKLLLDEITKDSANPENSYYYYCLGTTLSLQGNYNEALTYLTEAKRLYLEVSDDYKGILYCNILRNTIVVLLQQEEYEEAKLSAELVLKAFPLFTDANFYLAYSFFKTGKFSESIKIYHKIISNISIDKELLEPKGLLTYGESLIPEVYTGLAACYIITGEYLKSEKFLQEAWGKGINNPLILKYMLLNSLLMVNLSESLKYYYLISEPDINTKIQDTNIIALGKKHWRYKAKLIKMMQLLLLERIFSEPENRVINSKIKELAPKLSVCMIVKNEEEFIQETLESVFELAYEIIILDTGSTDKTKEIIATYCHKPFNNVRLYETIWEDDFAKARNVCAGYATGDWILRIDGDEKLTEKSRLLLLPFLADQNPELPLAFNFKIIEPQIVNGEKIYNTYYKNILYRNSFGIHFTRPRHEYLTSKSSNLNTRECSFLELYHSANLKKNLKNKSSENIVKMLEEADKTDDIREKYFYYYFTGNSYNMLADYENSTFYYEKALELIKTAGETRYRIFVLRNLVITLLFYKKSYLEALSKLDELIKIVPGHPDLYYYYGYALQNLGHPEKAGEYYYKALSIIDSVPVNNDSFFCDLQDLKKRIEKEMNYEL